MTDPSPEMPTAPTGLLGGLAPWFGAKRTLAPEIVRELGPHGAYWEPFCGSCAVLFAKPPISFETVNDLHGDLVNLAMVLASDRWQDLCARAVRTLPAEDLYLTCRDRLRAPLEVPAGPAACGDEHVERAWAYLVVSWQGLNGTAGTKTYNQHWSVRWSATGGRWGWADVPRQWRPRRTPPRGRRWPPLRPRRAGRAAGHHPPSTRPAQSWRVWRSRLWRVPETIPWWHERLRTVTIMRRDGFGVLEEISDGPRQPQVSVYVDPPYVAKSDRYLHDFRAEDHERLARLLGRFRRARVVVSYYDHPEVRRLYEGWTIRRLPAAKKNLCHSARNAPTGRQPAPEILIMNGPSMVGAEQASLWPPKEAEA